MFDFLRNLTKTDEEKQQEKLSAYLDNGLTPEERAAFEEALKADPALQASLEAQRLVKQNLAGLPRLRAPRNFTLDPALYGRPTSSTVFKLYPVMRTATALAALVLIFLFSLDLLSTSNKSSDMVAQAPAAAESSSNGFTRETAEEALAPAEPEMFGADQNADQVEEAVEEPMEEAMTEEEPVEEESAAEAAVAVEEMEEEAVAEDVAAEPPAQAEDGESDNSAGGAAVGESDLPFVVSAGDGTVATLIPPITPTQRISQTVDPAEGVTTLYSETQTVGGNDGDSSGLNGSAVSTRRLLQIGLGGVFLLLLVGTWLLRRQL